MPITTLNLVKFEKFLTSASKYVKASRKKGHSFDVARRTNLSHLTIEKPETRAKKTDKSPVRSSMTMDDFEFSNVHEKNEIPNIDL